MNEVHQPIPEGTPGCPKCEATPRMFMNLGTLEVHLECPPCRIRLWDCTTAKEALDVWNQLPRT